MLGALMQSVLSKSCSASKACMAGLATAGTGSGGFLKAGEGGVVAQPTGGSSLVCRELHSYNAPVYC